VIVISSIPQEIVSALESRTFSLHVKGCAGTGKTTMALELMRLFPEDGQAVYLSTRVSPDKLYEQFPWSKSCIHQENILDANVSSCDKTKEENLFEYVDKPSFLRNLYSRVSNITKNHVTIIVDSLEALKSNLNIPQSDLSVERDVIEIGERANANVIFISELSGDSSLDYLVDGVVRLEKEVANNRLLRKLYLEKVRGKRIENPAYLFTLKDGRFTCFGNGIQINYAPAELPKVEKEKGRKISTSIWELDNILDGGFERGTFNLFEVGDRVGLAHGLIMTPMIFEFMHQNIPVFYLPSKGFSALDVTRYFPSSFLTEDIFKHLKRYFHVFRPLKTNIKARSPSYKEYSIRGVNFNEDLNSFKELAVGVLGELKADTLFVLVAMDTMEYIYGLEDIPKIIQSWMDEIKQLNGIMALFRFGHESNAPPVHLAASYFKIENIGGNIVFYGEIPKTKMYVATLDLIGKEVHTRLVPIE
jgi:KaiC/GvpD/RAD55 family RecA-like ATPase